ncbi:ATP-grasp fold amidoligase family protein [Natronospira bacteriovora]|uniref:ATP-grasp fold amidoligase family protein n=1 Tax=Natronospira bacteriovora TaxID=3069753 RepID=A0ABU0W7W3_9GAMM|nr:ATP-grasp fold amidoligase family protein [Natronospira sp. AB-CW4]MDQ2070117.1 ATP-grasp fold amidoligase family protein [Natronospira sp. AB-CW4]
MTTSEFLRGISARLDRLFGYRQECRRFRRDVGYRPNLRHPRSFNEKILCRKLFDHDPRFPRVNGKLCMREYLRETLGERVEPHLVPVEQVIARAEDFDPASLPEACVLKPAHSSGKVLVLEPGRHPEGDELIRIVREWLGGPSFGDRHHEWLYSQVPRRVLVEPLLQDREGRLPLDYKLFVFHGRVKLIQVDFERFTGHRRSLYTPDWRKMDVRYVYEDGPTLDEPAGLETMIELAESAAAGFDFLRVDLYNLDGRILVGELTCYPESGRGRFWPESFDFEMGSWW